MSEIQTSKCVNCSQSATFDAKQAYENLARDYMRLADLVQTYMSQAGLDRTTRNSNALEMSKQLARIVGGTEVSQGRYPECCLIGREFPNGSMEWFCTGVLIHPQVVLSAAHCHQPPGLIANVVALNCEDKDRLGHAEIIPARQTRVHPNYALTGGLHDISVLILRGAAQTPPVAIASANETNAAEKTILVGFGRSDLSSTRGFGIKREVEVDITNIRRSPEDDLNDVEQQLGFESDIEFTAGGNGFDSCNGDSGGPAYIMVGKELKVAGLTSRAAGFPITPCGSGGVYTRVDMNFDFVQRVANQAGIQLN